MTRCQFYFIIKPWVFFGMGFTYANAANMRPVGMPGNVRTCVSLCVSAYIHIECQGDKPYSLDAPCMPNKRSEPRSTNPPPSTREVDFDQPDPTLFCTAYKRVRFYLFTRREPEEADECAVAVPSPPSYTSGLFSPRPTPSTCSLNLFRFFFPGG